MFQTTDEHNYSCVDLLRHGECEGGNIFRGSKDVSLTPLGVAQMQSAVNTLEGNWHTILSSPLTRCRKFAQDLAKQKEMPFRLVDNLKEMSFGQWEGREIDRVYQEDHDNLQAWRTNPALNPPPDGEPLEEVAHRAQQVLNLIQQELTGRNLLLVTHGGFIRVLLNVVLQAPLANAACWHIPFAGIVRLHLHKQGEGWRWQIEMQSRVVTA